MTRAIALLLLLGAIGADAAEVAVTFSAGKVGARIDALSFPPTLAKELTSGLTNRLYARVSLTDTHSDIGRKVVEIAIRYDLWDQKFSVVSTMEGAVVESRAAASLADVNALLAALPLPSLFDVATLPSGIDLELRVEVLLNPIDREKMQMIRKWVAQNSTPELGGDQGVSMSNALFNRIFEQYADGSNVAAAWRVTVLSAPFRLEGLRHEGR